MLLGVVMLVITFGAGAGWLLLDRSWSTTVRNSLIGVLLVGAGILLLGVMGIVFVQLHVRALRGSVWVAGLVLGAASLSVVVFGADLALHLAGVVAVGGEDSGDDVLAAAVDLYPLYVAGGFLYGAWGLIRLARGGSGQLFFEDAIVWCLS